VSDERQQQLQHLIEFLRTVQKPNKPIEQIGPDENLVTSGLIDSLALVEIVVYLENTYGIDFGAHGFEPERLSSMSSILEFIEQART